MNERIRELFDRAEHQAQKQSGSDWEVYVEPSREQIFEKFAELIVGECIGIVEKNESEMHYDNGMYPVHPTVCEIKEHFGVES
jgi:hypothetical protein